jgi:hypothetical protein
MDTVDAGRKGGSSKSARKKASSAANLAKARAITAAALAAFRAAGEKTDAAAEAFHATHGAREYADWNHAADVEIKTTKTLTEILPTLLDLRNGSE